MPEGHAEGEQRRGANSVSVFGPDDKEIREFITSHFSAELKTNDIGRSLGLPPRRSNPHPEPNPNPEPSPKPNPNPNPYPHPTPTHTLALTRPAGPSPLAAVRVVSGRLRR